MKNRIMIDIETLGTQAGCVVVSIGAARFTETGLDTHYVRLDWRRQQADGLALDADTVLWWMKREEAARAELTAEPRLETRAALEQLAAWMTMQGKVDELWGNGADFDCVILGALFRHYKLAQPWRYSAHRCYRTLAGFFPETKLLREGTHHHALADAIDQVRHLVRLLALVPAAPAASAATP